MAEKDLDDPVARAEKALAGLSGEFKNWMVIETDGSRPPMPPFSESGFTPFTCEELFRAAHDIKGDAATFGFPSAGAAAESLCRIIEHAPDLDEVPSDLIAHHINAIQAIVRERTKLDTVSTASELSRQLRGVADEFLAHANRDRPEHLEAILAPSIAPGGVRTFGWAKALLRRATIKMRCDMEIGWRARFARPTNAMRSLRPRSGRQRRRRPRRSGRRRTCRASSRANSVANRRSRISNGSVALAIGFAMRQHAFDHPALQARRPPAYRRIRFRG